MLQPWIDTLLDRMAAKLMNAAASRVEGKLEQDLASVKGELLSASLRYEAAFGTQAGDIRERLRHVSAWLGHDQPLESLMSQKPEDIERAIALLLANSSAAEDAEAKTSGTSKSGKGRRSSDRNASVPELGADGVPMSKRRRGRPKKEGRHGPVLSVEDVESQDDNEQEVAQ